MTLYIRILQLVPKDFHAAYHTQHSVVVLKPSTFTGSGETTGVAATHEVRVHAATCIPDTYRFHQVPGDIQVVPTVLRNTQDSHMNYIPGPAELTVNAIGPVDTAMSQLDVTNIEHHQTLRTLSTVANGITRVCHPNSRRSSLTDASRIDHPYAQKGLQSMRRSRSMSNNGNMDG